MTHPSLAEEPDRRPPWISSRIDTACPQRIVPEVPRSGQAIVGTRLDSREAILKGGTYGPAIVPGKPDESLLVQAVAHSHDELKMPPKAKLPDPTCGGLAAVGRDGCSLGECLGPEKSPKTG